MHLLALLIHCRYLAFNFLPQLANLLRGLLDTAFIFAGFCLALPRVTAGAIHRQRLLLSEQRRQLLVEAGEALLRLKIGRFKLLDA